MDAMETRLLDIGPIVLRALATLVVVDSLLLAPSWIANGTMGPHVVALEAVFVTGLFLALPRRPWSMAAAWIVAGLLVAIGVLWLGEATARLSLARSLNLYLDLRLLGAVGNLLGGTLGPFLGPAVVVLAISGVVAAVVALALLLASLRTEGREGRRRIAGIALLTSALALVPMRWLHPAGAVFGLTSVDLVLAQSRQLDRMLDERTRFADELDETRSSYRDTPGLLRGLGGRDVLLAFIESYGVTALDDERYAPVVRPRLEEMAHRLEEAGLHMATGKLLAPSQGGQSWLGHGSVLSGLWLENQLRYDLLLASDRETLVDDFDAAGYRTVAVMPAITMAWPEGERFGYDRIYARDDISYAGPPLNWVTMPDQFTWSFFQKSVRDSTEAAPLFAELGLISSHAPWTPILPVLDDWERIDDGAIFQAWAHAGETPEALWRDRDRVREHYARAVAYAVDVLASYSVRYVDPRTLLIAMGDHQPAPLITGDSVSRAVPVHVISGDRTLVEPFLEWGFAEGSLPPSSSPSRRMDAFRDWFVHAFSDGDGRIKETGDGT
ncbi:MAG: hypothetical protein R3304_12165 [Longimicrobiales bacterium]|nr:hypothetical protein [Longimicrobiales bacterium]